MAVGFPRCALLISLAATKKIREEVKIPQADGNTRFQVRRQLGYPKPRRSVVPWTPSTRSSTACHWCQAPVANHGWYRAEPGT